MLVGRHACFRQALSFLLERERGLRTVAQSKTLSGTRGQLTEPVDVAVVDFSLPDGRGTDLVKDFRKLNPGSAVLVLTEGPDPEESSLAAQAGAEETLDKTVTAARIVEAVERLGRTRTAKTPKRASGTMTRGRWR